MPTQDGFGAQARQAAINAGFNPNRSRGRQTAQTLLPGIQAEQQTQQDVARLQPSFDFIDTRADITEGQLRNQGLAGLAQQFQSARRQNAFDVARRGTQGGSRDLERTADIEGARDRGIVDVFTNSAQQAEQQRAGQTASLDNFGNFLRQGDPLEAQRRQLALQDLQAQGNVARGDFDLSQSFENLRAGNELNRAGLIRSGFQTAASGIDAAGDIFAERRLQERK